MKTRTNFLRLMAGMLASFAFHSGPLGRRALRYDSESMLHQRLGLS